jgi:uncharacterized protein with von Willebrand factor type A (vWA) domain
VPEARALDHAIIRFGRLLREHGVGVSGDTTATALRALEAVDLSDRDEVRLALRAVFPATEDEVRAFDRCFAVFFGAGRADLPEVNEVPLPPDPRQPPRASREPVERMREQLAASIASGATSVTDWGGDGDDDDPPLETAAASQLEALGQKDFSTFTPSELADAMKLARRLARRLASRAARRRRPTAARGAIDLRRTLRRNVSQGHVVRLAYRRPRRRPPRLVALCDVSGSMDLYSRVLLQFLHGMQGAFPDMETFVFGTRLTRVTPHLKRQTFGRMIEALAAVRDWSGGTRIGESLERFVRDYGPRLLGRRTAVLVLSDGWDTGDPDRLAGALAAIRERGARILWLNPLLGQPDYQPLTRGMAAALPLVHAFLPAHNLASLVALERGLARV